MPETYYAYTDKAEQSGGPVFLEFHCLREAEVEPLLNSAIDQFRAYIAEIPTRIIFVQTDPESLKTKLKFEEIIEEMEGQWYRLVTNDQKNGLPATLFQENPDGAGVALFVSVLEALDQPTRNSLDQQTAIDDTADATKEEIELLLNRHTPSTAEYVAVYQVGQGNCNAVCDRKGMPLLYFDLGGGCFHNHSTYPAVLRFCFSEDPLILLSHWDTDHYESARRNTTYQAKTWIVPRQKFGPAHLKFFRQLQASGNVLIWPAAITTLPFRFGTVHRCQHPSALKKNHTGLAISTSLHSAVNTITQVLLPADAAYTYIYPHMPPSFQGIVATHHGAEFDHGNTPVPGTAGAGAIAYSYGHLNTYGHPKVAAIAAHSHPHRRDSIAGHIALADCPLHTPGCGGGSCDLGIAQYY